MILDCMVGNVNICYLYIHPSNSAKLLKEDSNLTPEECLVLNLMSSLKPAYREKEFFEVKYKDYRQRHVAEETDEYKKILKSLEEKGLVKINAAGSSQLTLDGKNAALSPKVKEQIRKLKGY
jgi:chromosome condensin MukBEF MukE localization factor